MADSADTVKKIFPYLAIGIFLILVFVYVASISEGDIAQPIAYKHKIHIENAGLTCADCHAGAETSASATIPRLEVCQNCHSEEPLSDSPEEQKLLSYISRGAEVPWERVYHVPDHVYFSHKRHVVGGELECAACHGNTAEFTQPVSQQFLPVTMENCMNCHRERNASNDCLSCHR